jgi:protein TonB
MFSTLESTWDQSARRGWSTLASFGFQALTISLLLAIPLVWIQRPPLVTWLSPVIAPVTSPEPVQPAEPAQQHYRAGSVSEWRDGHVLQPTRIPRATPDIDDSVSGPPAPYIPGIDFGPSRSGSNAVPWGPGSVIPVMPKPPVSSHPPRISHWAEGNLVYRVQPVYPALARQVRVQGPVLLRAIVSKTGTIEHLTVISGHPLLVKAALDAVQQWRYRPYLLNDEPIEIETEITVNFVLSGN